MKCMLYRRYPRELRENIGIYIAIFLIITVGLGTVLGGNAGDDSMIEAVENFFETANLSSGYVDFAYPLEEQIIKEAEDNNIYLEEQFYFDADTNGNVLRIFQNRTEQNQAFVSEGRLPESETEIFLEKHYAEAGEYQALDKITVEDSEFQISGIGSLPDYIYVLKKSSDLTSHTESFSVATVTKESFEKLKTEKKASVVYHYSFSLAEGATMSDAEAFFKEETENPVFELVDSSKDPRVITHKEDCAMVKRATFVFAVILLIITAYVMGVFLKNRVEKESIMIGTLSSLGYRKGELIRHYLGMPVIVSILGGAGSLLCGYFIFSRMLTKDSVDLYSMPDFSVTMPGYIILFALVVPALIMALIGFSMLTGKITSNPQDLMRAGGKEGNAWNINLDKFSYIAAFRIRQFMKEISGNLVMVGGIFAATVLLLLGFSIYSSVDYYKENVLNDVFYNNMYLVAQNQEIPDQGEALLVQNMKYESELSGTDLNVTLMGIQEDSSYFPFQVSEKAEEITVSKEFAKKLNIKEGDDILLFNSTKSEKYSFKVKNIVPYSNGLSLFLNRDILNEIIGEEKGNYNAVVSVEELDTEGLSVLSHTKASEYEDAADTMLDSLLLIIVALLGSAAVIFVMVVYLMIKFMVDKAKNNISLLKILGYYDQEVNKIYLGCENYVAAAAILLSLPLGQCVIRGIFPYLTSGYSVYLIPYIPLEGYIVLIIFMMLSYFITYAYLKTKLRKIEFTEILKNRE